MMWITRLDEAIKAVAPIHGVAVVSEDKATWRIHFKDEATPQQIAAAQAALTAFNLSAPAASDVDDEWSRRVFGEFVFQGETYHADRDSVDNIIGAASMARAAMSEGVQAGNLYWHCPDPSSPPENAVPFAWKSKSNGLIPMDAPTVEALAKALFAHKHSHFLAARALKEMDPIPSDYTSDTYWP